MEFIDLHSIFKDNLVISSIPNYFNNSETPIICYKYNKVSKGAKLSRYNQVPHPTQDTNGKVTNSQLDTTKESQEVSPFPAGDHKANKPIRPTISNFNKIVTDIDIDQILLTPEIVKILIIYIPLQGM